MEKRYVHNVMIAMIWLLAACSVALNPDEVLTKYLSALDKGNYQEAYNYISAQDKAIITAADFAKKNAGTSAALLAEAFREKFSFAVREITTTGTTATISVLRTMPDVRAILNSMTADAASGGFMEKDFKKLSAKDIRAKLKGKEIPVMTTIETYAMLREGENWKISFDWKKQVEEKAKQDKIAALLSEANQLRKINNLPAAIDKYNQVLALDNDLPQALVEKAEVEKELRLLQEKQAYYKNIELQNIRIEKQKARGSDAIKESIVGTVINQGDRTLDRVKIAVYFLDQDGKEIEYPALATEFFYREENQPLTPKSKRDFGFTIEGYAPPTWGGKVEVKITDLEFDTREQGDKNPPVPAAAATTLAPTTTTSMQQPAALVPKDELPAAVATKEAAAHNGRYHRVKPKETVYSIARRYGMSADELYRLNSLEKTKSIRPGQKLLVAP